MALEINIDHHFTSKVYTTGSIVDGHVSVAAELLETCDAVDICLVGIGKKRLELSHFSTRNPADWRFLNMRMPRQDIPTMRASITEGDQLPHRIPFRFVIPEHLTIEPASTMPPTPSCTSVTSVCRRLWDRGMRAT